MPDYLDRTRFPVDPWRLTEEFFSPVDLGVAETLFAVGNGYVGMRGTFEEGRDAVNHGTFVNGVHETWRIQHAEQAYGLAEVGQTIVSAPDATLFELYVDDEPLVLSVADLIDYRRSLDFTDGLLRRELIWRTPSGHRVQVRSQRMTSFVQRHLAVLTYEVTALDDEVPIAISARVVNREDGEHRTAADERGGTVDPRRGEEVVGRVLHPEVHWGDEDRVLLGYRCENSGNTIAVGVDHILETENELETVYEVTPDRSRHVYRGLAMPFVPITVTKVVAYHSSRGEPAGELITRVRRTLDRVRAQGVEQQLADQRAWLEDYWARSDVEVEDQPEIQQAIRWCLYQVAQASARAEGQGIPAKGVTGSGYSGHYFWDTETYAGPYLVYPSPSFARNALRFRATMLPAARRRAVDLTQRGALYPWRTINGEEASAYYAAGTAQYHINADISFALSTYVKATGDEEFLAREGIDILVETARMWADLGFWRGNGEDSFHVHGVTGPDEYTTVVNDNLFTNVMARFNLWRAADAVGEVAARWPVHYERMVQRLGLSADEVLEWRRAADAMEIPYDARLGIHPQDSLFLEREVWDLPSTPPDELPLLLHYHPLVIYRFQVLKQADVVLALFLQGEHFTLEEKRADFAYYDAITTGDSTLSGVVQAIIAAEVGYHDLALRYFHDALFVDLADLHENTADGVHVASAGGVWSALVYGFGGMRHHGDQLTFAPRLPMSWPSLTFRVADGPTRLKVVVRQDTMDLTVEVGEEITVAVLGKPVTVTSVHPVTVALQNQGPRIDGMPEATALRGTLRADGTVITASVPHHSGRNR
ncbi:glycoside hydrolase family 65 protein [Actinotalea sp. M2MS4P-6]|nr:glycoside hydrolase family 65 protein [Actinotalea sp. M2MS4P-6]